MSIRSNGSYIGFSRTPSTSQDSASGIWSLSAAERQQRAAAWPPSRDPDFASVELLLHMDGSNGSTTFTDSSSNGLSVTASGNAQISTTEGKFGGASGLFDGNNDYLSVSDSGLAFGTGDFTIELFFYRVGDTAVNNISSAQLLDFRTPSLSSEVLVYVAGSAAAAGTVKGLTFYAGAERIQTSSSVSDNTWHHAAIVRSSGTTTMYLDGVSAGTWADSSNYTSTAATIGGRFADVSGDYRSWNGYIDELRITKGVARYTANFTPPTAAFLDI